MSRVLEVALPLAYTCPRQNPGLAHPVFVLSPADPSFPIHGASRGGDGVVTTPCCHSRGPSTLGHLLLVKPSQ